MNKKLIRKKLRNSRACVYYYALDPLKQSIKNLSAKDTLDDISSIQESIRDTYLEFYSAFKERTATIISALLWICVAIADLLFIALFV